MPRLPLPDHPMALARELYDRIAFFVAPLLLEDPAWLAFLFC